MANIVAVKQIGVLALGVEYLFQRIGDRRFARARKPHQHKDLAILDGERAIMHAQHLPGRRFNLGTALAFVH